jgi:hypothetical protein
MEQLRQVVAGAATVTCFSCIACSSADWVRGLARLISSAISSWVKTGPAEEAEAAAAVGALLHHFRTGDVGRHQVGGELDAPPVQPQHNAQRLHQLGLGQAGHADQGFTIRADPREVADVFEVPLDHFLDERNHRLDSRMAQGRERRFYAMPYEGRYIWGATAGMLKNLQFILTAGD